MYSLATFIAKSFIAFNSLGKYLDSLTLQLNPLFIILVATDNTNSLSSFENALLPLVLLVLKYSLKEPIANPFNISGTCITTTFSSSVSLSDILSNIKSNACNADIKLVDALNALYPDLAKELSVINIALFAPRVIITLLVFINITYIAGPVLSQSCTSRTRTN